MTMPQGSPFQIPEQLRELAERSVDQARTAYGQFMDAMLNAQSKWSVGLPTSTITGGFKEIQELAIKFARQNADANFALATDLARAKDIAEVLAIQSRFAQSQMQAYASQAQDLGRLVTQAAQKVSKG
jgi:phasin